MNAQLNTDDIEFTSEEQVQRLRKQKAQIEQHRLRSRIRWSLFPVFVVIGFLAGGGVAAMRGGEDVGQSAISGAASAIGLFVIYLVSQVYWQFSLRSWERGIDRKLLKAGAAQLQDTIEEDFVTKLVKINFKYLDQYYEQTQAQANKSFFLSAFASLVGLTIIGCGIFMMFFELTEPAYVTTAAGVASEFIAAVFFYLYNRTISKMAEYHNKLVVTQNVSLALKIAEGLDEPSRQEAQRQLIDRLSENVNLHLTQPTPTK
jgi:hypothetical protein